jgi:hypothetical protein
MFKALRIVAGIGAVAFYEIPAVGVPLSVVA